MMFVKSKSEFLTCELDTIHSFIAPAVISIGTSALLGRFLINYIPSKSYGGLFMPSLYGSFLNILIVRSGERGESFSSKLVRIHLSFLGGALLAICLKGRVQLAARDALSIAVVSILFNTLYQVGAQRRRVKQIALDQLTADPKEQNGPDVEMLKNYQPLSFIMDYASIPEIAKLGSTCKRMRLEILKRFVDKLEVKDVETYVREHKVLDWLDTNNFQSLVFYHLYQRSPASCAVLKDNQDFMKIVLHLERDKLGEPEWQLFAPTFRELFLSSRILNFFFENRALLENYLLHAQYYIATLDSVKHAPRCLRESSQFAVEYFRTCKRLKVGFSIQEQLQYFSPKVRDCEEVVFAAVSRDENAFQYASERLKNDRSFLLRLCKAKGEVILKAKRHFLRDEGLVIQALSSYGALFPSVDRTLQDSPEFRIRALEANGLILEYLSDSEKDDRATVLRAVNKRGMALGFASRNQRSDANVVKAAVSSDPLAIQFALNENDEIWTIFEEGLKKNPVALQFAKDRLKSNKELVLELVTLDGKAFQFASESLRDNQEIALRAANSDVSSFPFASQRLRDYKPYVLAYLEKVNDLKIGNHANLHYLNLGLMHNRAMFQDKDVWVALIKIDKSYLSYIPDHLKTDRGFIKEVAKVRGSALEYFHYDVRDDEEIATLAIQKHPSNVRYISDRLKHDQRFLGKFIL